MNYYIYLFGNIGLILCIISLSIISLSMQDWASQGTWQGSLLKTSSVFYKDAPCHNSSSKCETYSKLWKSGILLLACDILSICSLTLLIFQLYRLINQVRIPVIIIFTIEALAFIFHLIGYLVWIIMNNVNYNNKCSTKFEETEHPDICARSGPILSLVILVLMPLQVACLVFALRSVRKKNKKKNLEASKELKDFDSDRI